MNSEVEFHIRNNDTWAKLPANVKQSLGNSQKEYEKWIVQFSLGNQLRYKGNLIRLVRRDERRYYEDVLDYSKQNLMLYPYHLSDVVVKGLRVTPFQYYTAMMESIMAQEKSYDSLPNFTAADCLRLLGIGRNEYIELMNQYRTRPRLFRKKTIRDLLPAKPAKIMVKPWWNVEVGLVIEDDIKLISEEEKKVIDKIIDNGTQKAGDLDINLIHNLYLKGLIYLDVPIEDDDCIIVPPLKGFVMNRVLGDYFETLLYKIFVSIDEHTTVGELANVLQIDPQAVKNAVSLYCRLGFAYKKCVEDDPEDTNAIWKAGDPSSKKSISVEPVPLDLTSPFSEAVTTPTDDASSGTEEVEAAFLSNQPRSMRIAFLFDSTLTAFLMMGNLSPGLKNHAVTMFEVGKLSDESLDSFVTELDSISTVDSEGEAQRYFEHAFNLRSTIGFLRSNPAMGQDLNLPLDLVRCESLQSLDPATCTRLLVKNYRLLVSMAPLSKEIRPISSCMPPHLGPAIPEVNSVWFKLFIYYITGYGPPSLLLVKGSRIKRLPAVFCKYEKLLVTTWGHDPGVLPVSNIIFTLNEALCHSAVLVQAYGISRVAETFLVPFPMSSKPLAIGGSFQNVCTTDVDWNSHPAVRKLSDVIDLKCSCGFITMVDTENSIDGHTNKSNFYRHTPEESKCISPISSSGSNVESFVEAWVKTGSPDDTFEEPTSVDLLPSNGFTNGECASVLKKEIDSIYPEKLNIKSKSVDNEIRNDSSLLSSENDSSEKRDLENISTDINRWTLLECSFGIPLFNQEINREICKNILHYKLYQEDSLRQLTHSSRKLCLNLLDFIAKFQELPVLQEELSNIYNKQLSNVVLPTRNLLFIGGELRTWDGK
ncbi:protein FAM91A1 isoform X1 [Schistocerca gregaria]|uniref:protein FAM91A1 isoform X1 n=2 Tax=Schistocerca gregaria TaxID=7010 RepID=UPI00211E0E31|nr:protein FAM91A1 isoform X1 [Schistocerca gregaria]